MSKHVKGGVREDVRITPSCGQAGPGNLPLEKNKIEKNKICSSFISFFLDQNNRAKEVNEGDRAVGTCNP